jgi:hypothetical protein
MFLHLGHTWLYLASRLISAHQSDAHDFEGRHQWGDMLVRASDCTAPGLKGRENAFAWLIHSNIPGCTHNFPLSSYLFNLAFSLSLDLLFSLICILSRVLHRVDRGSKQLYILTFNI